MKGNSYTVTFDSDGGTKLSAVEVKKDGNLTLPKEPTKKGYVFTGWQVDGKAFDENQKITDDLALKATWAKEGAKYHEVTFKYENGEDSKVVKAEDKSVLAYPATPKRSGYLFKGWFESSKEFDFTKPVESDVTLIAHWEKQNSDCPSGYSKYDGRCRKLVSTVAATKSCVSGYTLEDGSCVKRETTQATQTCLDRRTSYNGKCYRYYKRAENYFCPSGYQNPAGTDLCRSVNYSSGDPACFDQYSTYIRSISACHRYRGDFETCQPGQAHLNPLQPKACYVTTPGSLICPEKKNYYLVSANDNKECKYYHQQDAVVGSCAAGSTLINGGCYNDPVAPNITCASGYSLRETTCYRLLTSTVKYSCNTGYTLSGTSCLKYDYKAMR